MLQVKSNLRSICSNLGQFVSTQVNLLQPRSICFNLGQFDFFVFAANKKIFLAPSIFSSFFFFSLSPLYLPYLLFPPCSPNPSPYFFHLNAYMYRVSLEPPSCLTIEPWRLGCKFHYFFNYIYSSSNKFPKIIQIRHTYKREYTTRYYTAEHVPLP